MDKYPVPVCECCGHALIDTGMDITQRAHDSQTVLLSMMKAGDRDARYMSRLVRGEEKYRLMFKVMVWIPGCGEPQELGKQFDDIEEAVSYVGRLDSGDDRCYWVEDQEGNRFHAGDRITNEDYALYQNHLHELNTYQDEDEDEYEYEDIPF
jgi:FAD/FMN-containing dehydrogenase